MQMLERFSDFFGDKFWSGGVFFNEQNVTKLRRIRPKKKGFDLFKFLQAAAMSVAVAGSANASVVNKGEYSQSMVAVSQKNFGYNQVFIGDTTPGNFFGLSLVNIGTLEKASVGRVAGRHFIPKISATSTQGQAPLSALLNDASKSALGAGGVARLSDFENLASGWDGLDAAKLSFKSFETFNYFFALTNLKPPRMGAFMSSEGNLIVNWVDQFGKIIELEFLEDCVSVYSELSDDTHTLYANDAAQLIEYTGNFTYGDDA